MSERNDCKRQRKFLGNAFTFEKLKAQILMINEVVNRIADPDSKTNLNQFTSKITGEVVIHSFLGELAEGLKFDGKDAQVALVEVLNETSVLQLIKQKEREKEERNFFQKVSCTLLYNTQIYKFLCHQFSFYQAFTKFRFSKSNRQKICCLPSSVHLQRSKFCYKILKY